MSPNCPNCREPVEPTDKFCVHCGTRLPTAAESAGGLPRPADLAISSATGPKLLVEVETNRPFRLRHACLLRFRVTNMASADKASCDVTIRMRLNGQGRLVEQEMSEIQQTCRLQRRGDPDVFAFPFQPLTAGDIRVDELQVAATWSDHPRGPIVDELPDKSLLVSVSDPSAAQESPNVVISGGIHIDFHELREVYGGDIQNILTINAQREAARGEPGIAWQPLRLCRAEQQPFPASVRLLLPGDLGLDLVRIAVGEFRMGSPDDHGKPDERLAHQVRLSRDFCLGRFPVTQAQYQTVVGANPSKFPLSPQHPVDNVSWDDARAFCRRLEAYLGESPGSLQANPGREAGGCGRPLAVQGVRLPTEAEWEYACRAGTQTLYSFGDDRQKLGDYGWYEKNSGRTTQPVGQCKPNPWGLYDMHGGLWEWCEDFYAPGYAAEAVEDPSGPEAGNRRVLRGGSWSYYAADCRSASRHSAQPSDRTANYGFRVALSVTRRLGP